MIRGVKMVYYKHLKTNAVISLDKLKDYYNNSDRYLVFGKTEPSLKMDELVNVERYQYKTSEIPFSEDFEVIVLDNDFTLSELSFIEHLLHQDIWDRYSDMTTEIQKKIKTKKINVIKERELKCQMY